MSLSLYPPLLSLWVKATVVISVPDFMTPEDFILHKISIKDHQIKEK